MNDSRLEDLKFLLFLLRLHEEQIEEIKSRIKRLSEELNVSVDLKNYRVLRG